MDRARKWRASRQGVQQGVGVDEVENSAAQSVAEKATGGMESECEYDQPESRESAHKGEALEGATEGAEEHCCKLLCG